VTAFESVVEEAAIAHFQELGYSYLPGVDLAEERGTISEVFLQERLRGAVERFNEGLPEAGLDEAARRILQPPTASVEENNQVFHRYLTKGIELEVLGKDGVRGEHAWAVDWADADANDWLVTNQLTVRGPQRLARPDLVVYLNGIPVAVFELKSSTSERTSLHQAWRDIQGYKKDIPALFDTNEICAISTSAWG